MNKYGRLERFSYFMVLKSFLLFLFITNFFVSAYAGNPTATLTSRTNYVDHVEYVVAISCPTGSLTGTCATTIPIHGMIGGVCLNPGSTGPKAGTVVKFLHPTATTYDLLGGMMTTTSTSDDRCGWPYDAIAGTYGFSIPVDGNIAINITVNDVANSSFDITFSVYRGKTVNEK
jgi:hypothetical protein